MEGEDRYREGRGVGLVVGGGSTRRCGSSCLVMEKVVYSEGDLLTVAEAARVARRSVRTIRRAYKGGTLVAYRDAGGRGVRVRYEDLCRWMTSEMVVTALGFDGLGAVGVAGKRRLGLTSSRSENLALLAAARHRREARVGDV